MSARRPEGVSVHDWQHDLIGERIQAWTQHPRRTGRDRLLRRERLKKAHGTLQGHLSGCHGFRHSVGPSLTIETLHEIHARYHSELD